MATYVDYQYYKDDFGGVAISETDFSPYATRASREIDRITMYRIQSDSNPDGYVVDDKVKNATCAIADVLFKRDKSESESGNIKAESVGQHSVTYNVVDAEKADAVFKKTLRDAARGFLTGTGLLYTGISTCRRL